MMELRRHITIWDMAILVGAVLIALLLLAWMGTGPAQAGGRRTIVVMVRGAEVLTVVSGPGDPLRRYPLQLPGGRAWLEVEGGRARLVPDGAFCPLGLCWRTGWISEPGQAIVCAPNGLVIVIRGQGPLDAVTR